MTEQQETSAEAREFAELCRRENFKGGESWRETIARLFDSHTSALRSQLEEQNKTIETLKATLESRKVLFQKIWEGEDSTPAAVIAEQAREIERLKAQFSSVEIDDIEAWIKRAPKHGLNLAPSEQEMLLGLVATVRNVRVVSNQQIADLQAQVLGLQAELTSSCELHSQELVAHQETRLAFKQREEKSDITEELQSALVALQEEERETIRLEQDKADLANELEERDQRLYKAKLREEQLARDVRLAISDCSYGEAHHDYWNPAWLRRIRSMLQTALAPPSSGEVKPVRQVLVEHGLSIKPDRAEIDRITKRRLSEESASCDPPSGEAPKTGEGE